MEGGSQFLTCRSCAWCPATPSRSIPGRRGDPSPSFLSDLQQILTGRTLLPTSHHSTRAPQELPEDLLLAKHVLVCRDSHVPPLAAAYDGPFLVLERSLRFFKLQIGDRIDTVSTLRLKPCTSPPDVIVAQPPRRGRHAAAAAAPPPEVVSPPTQKTSPKHAQRRRRVTFRCPVVTLRLCLHSVSTLPVHLPAPPGGHGGIWSAASTSEVRGLGGSCGETTSTDGSQLC
jgi:hypothetical protein